jgi:hypothetical protein
MPRKEGVVRNIIKVLTLLSLVATIGSFTLDLLPIVNGVHAPRTPASSSKRGQDLRRYAGSGGYDARSETVKYCILTMAVCGAGIAVIRVIRMRGAGG